jgi:hypothetical protein
VNLYLLVEGERTEKLVYRAWLRLLLPQLAEVNSPDDLRDNNYFIVTGNGYPSYLDRLRDSHKDIRDTRAVDHFFLCIDSEDMTYEEKLAEVEREISASERETKVYASNPSFRTHVIVQHCCLETWFLGNEKMMPVSPQTEPLKEYASFYDVRLMDPECMGRLGTFSRRAQFHFEYLKAMFAARRVRYSKSNPGSVVERHYYEALRARAEKAHIRSFGVLAKLLQELGATP